LRVFPHFEEQRLFNQYLLKECLMSSNTPNDPVPDMSAIEAEMVELCEKNAPILLAFALKVTDNQMIIREGIERVFLRYLGIRLEGQRIENPTDWLVQMLKTHIGYEGASPQLEEFQALSRQEWEFACTKMAGYGRKDIDRIMSIPRRYIARSLTGALRKE
jgi:hypothetical protein